MSTENLTFQKGLKDGIPIGLGYLAVSTAYGMASIIHGLTVFEAITISLTNLTSAGQFAGTTLIAAGALLSEIIITVSLINIRYFLMSLSLSQRIRPSVPLWQRLIMAFAVTDEIYAVAISQKGEIPFGYFLGLMILPIIGWVSGTALGAVASSFLPLWLANSLGIAMYAMFIAIFVPKAKEDKKVLECVIISIVLACLFAWLPGLNQISSGYSIVIITLIAAGWCALRYPKFDQEEGNDL